MYGGKRPSPVTFVPSTHNYAGQSASPMMMMMTGHNGGQVLTGRMAGNAGTRPPTKIKFFTDRNTLLAAYQHVSSPAQQDVRFSDYAHSATSAVTTTATTKFTNVVPAKGAHQDAYRPLMIEDASIFHQCETCGKVYKHRNCLLKHRWEHHESWEQTRRLCATKHQQVQMLEAAQVLLEMKLFPTDNPLHHRHHNAGSASKRPQGRKRSLPFIQSRVHHTDAIGIGASNGTSDSIGIGTDNCTNTGAATGHWDDANKRRHSVSQ